ncbi:hypothetical protein BCR32DRAFT_329326 [Anaeromyces robustus]|uniref:Man1/Src1-like C-terminal domain-containing protein n=1 Tax=Anaeromyces robustus TaxID=1754192 RepID=A0A1Y1WT92_9FUNG|nr:hypothetical protein BCR32DRAFT_329326 [Anaeromyces robustus]|eukprot:ORX76518.1 hypothetical protein BCR32DRAFT_329326 [Anaeromyces robustus]
MSGEIPDYLKKNFDPNSLSIPQLRSILKDHGVENVPAPNQPKRVFIKLFNNEIFSNRDEILKSLNIVETTKRRKSGRPKKSERDSEESGEYLKTDLPKALRSKSESPAPSGKDIKNKRVSFGVNELKVRYEPSNPTPPTTNTETVKEEIPMKEQVTVKDDKKNPLIQSTINKLNEEFKTNNSYSKSYNSEKTGIEKGNIKRARKTFSDSSSQDVELKKQSRVENDDDEPSQKKRKHNEKLTTNNPNTSSSNIFQKFDNQTQNVKSTSSSSSSLKIPKANIIYAENMDDEEDDEDYVYHSSPSISSPSEHEINDEEMEDLKKEPISDSNIRFSTDNNVELNYQDQYRPVPPSTSTIPTDSGVSSSKLDNVNYIKPNNSFSKYSKLEKPKSSISFSNANANNLSDRSNRLDKPNSSFQRGSTSFTYGNTNNSFSKSNRLDKPNTSFQKGSTSFTYGNTNNSFNRSSRLEKSKYSPNSSFQKGSSSFLKGDTSPYNTSFNDKPKINISYDMSPIQSSHSSVIYEDNLLNQVAAEDKSQDSSNIIGNLYEALPSDYDDHHDNESMEITTTGCPSGCNLYNLIFALMSFIITTTIGLFVQWYMNTGGFAGYCKYDKTSFSEITYLNDLPKDSILRYNPFYHILPKCLNCPENAFCANNHVVACKNDNEKLQNRLISSFIPDKYLVFPLTEKVCRIDYKQKRDSDRLLQNTRSLMNIANQLIRRKIGEVECKEEFDKLVSEGMNHGKLSLKKSGISVNKLKKLLKEEIGKISEDRFNTLWNLMIEKLKQYDSNKVMELCRPENIKTKWKTTEIKDDTYFCDILKKLAFIPNEGDLIEKQIVKDSEYNFFDDLIITSDSPIHSTKCCMKWFMERYICNNINRFIHRFWKYGLGMAIITLLATLFDLFIKRRNRRNNVVNSICEEVIWLLQEAEYQNKEDPLHFPSPNISVAQLYDILLPTIISPKDKNVPEGECVEIINNDGSTTHYWVFHNPKERALIWKRVYEQVRTNSNVLESNALVKRESHRCWEWIGNPTLYIRRKSPNTKNKQTTYIPKSGGNNSRLSLGGNNSRLSLGGGNINRSFNSQHFAGDISAISSSSVSNPNDSYVTLDEEVKETDPSTLKGTINKLSIFNNRRDSQILEDKKDSSSSSALYPSL